MPFRSLFPLLLAAGLAVGAWTTSPDAAPPDAPAADAVVEMTNTLAFTPDTVRIATGETVEWRNTSLIAHTVTADPEQATLAESVHLPEGAEPFDSGMLDPEQTFQHTFTTPGTYRYFCIPHEGAEMRGTVIVE
ncbi:MAG: hypothetical protein GVY18_09275 [Bacteroidetes bacterium]|jgi:plastocyanin|nr:hypothetical protein [Bacteroidota bacterium]